MNKNILAIAIAAAVAAPSAFAASTVYGVAHMAVEHGMDIGGGKAGSQTNIASNSSRLGIKGSEDLGNGLKAIYQFETTIALDGEGTAGNNSGFAGQRNSFVGLGGGFGTVLLGMNDTPLKSVRTKYDLFGDRIGDLRNLTSADYAGGGLTWDARPTNMVSYSTPNMNGFGATIAYYADEKHSENTVKNADIWSIGASYAAGALTADIAYENRAKGSRTTIIDTNTVTGTDTVTVTGTGANGGTQLSGKSMDAFRLGASYNFGTVKVNGFYAHQDAFDVITAKVKDRDVFALGAAAKVGAAGTIKGQVAHTTKVSGLKGTEATMWVVGYDHSLSKNTTVYAAYAYMDNAKDAPYSVAGAFKSSGAGQDGMNVGSNNAGNAKDNSAISVGVVHAF